MFRNIINRKLHLLHILFLFFVLVYFFIYTFDYQTVATKRIQNEINNKDDFIFVGGYGRSGTTLMRAILDAHHEIRCGPETKILPLLLQFRHDLLFKDKHLHSVLRDADENYQQIIDKSMRAFIHTFVHNFGLKSDRYCAKDPNLALHFAYLHTIFPNAKFILMIRDARAVANSYLNNIFQKGNDTRLHKHIVSNWNWFMNETMRQCSLLGEKYCMHLHYESLILNTETCLRRVVGFLDEQWTDSLMAHENFINNGIKVSKTEWSSDAIKQPINRNALDLWHKNLPIQFLEFIRTHAPMNEIVGYDFNANTSTLNKFF